MGVWKCFWRKANFAHREAIVLLVGIGVFIYTIAVIISVYVDGVDAGIIHAYQEGTNQLRIEQETLYLCLPANDITTYNCTTLDPSTNATNFKDCFEEHVGMMLIIRRRDIY
jgi:hypothetical protein